MKKLLLLPAFLIITILNSIHAKAPIKFGKISMNEMTMDKYEADTSSSAVILCRYGYFNTNDFRFREITRIKILKKEGLKYGTRVIETSSKSNIRGITYNLENGKIIKEKLKNNSIFEERLIENYYRMKVSMPNVKVGSVIDIEYSEDFLPSEFRFQEKIPVKYCELVLNESPYISFQKHYKGFIGIDQSNYGIYIAKNVPAFKAEPYISSINNFISKFEFEILEINIPGVYIPFSTNWDAVAHRLRESSNFGGALQGAMYLNSIVKEIEISCNSDEEKIKEAYKYSQKIRYNEIESCYASSESMGYVYRQEYGNSADINIVLIQILRKLGYSADPVVLSTRENGMLDFFPSRSKLNYVIAYMKLNEKEYLLDATDEYLPYNLLPRRTLNGRGRLIEKERNKFIPIKTSKEDKHMIVGNFIIDEDLTIKGKITYNKYDYAAADFRKEYKKFNSDEEYLENFLTDKPGVEITEIDIQNADSIYSPLAEVYSVEISNQLNVFGDEIYLSPLLFEQMKENEFKLDNRLYPVDFIIPIKKTYLFKFTIPEDYKVLKNPEPAKLMLPDNKGQILYSVTSIGNVINVVLRLSISDPFYTVSEYPFLKEFFNQIIKKQAEPVIISKK